MLLTPDPFESHFQVVEFFYRLISNADYDIVEKSDIETISAYEGSGGFKMFQINIELPIHSFVTSIRVGRFGVRGESRASYCR